MTSITQTIIKLRNDSGPWGSGSNQDPSNNNQNQGRKLSEDEIDNMIKKSQEFVRKVFKSGDDSNQKTPKSIIGMFCLGLVVLWMATGIYKVDSNENAVILYFGKFYSIATPGLNYHIPAPFGEVIKKSVTTVNTEEFGFNSKKHVGSESLMLTGDENIVDIDFQVQWQISDIKNFVFNVSNPDLTIKKAAESAMREIIAKSPIADALSDGKRKIEQDTKILLQETLDSYQTGVRVVLVQLRRVDPPSQVIDAFRDVQTAKADKEKEINQAEAYKNDIVPRARGAASETIEQAEAYKQEVIANAEGQASRFLEVYDQYIKAKTVTRKRMYLETMEKLYRDTNKVILDKNVSRSGVIPYMPMSDIRNQNSKKINQEKND